MKQIITLLRVSMGFVFLWAFLDKLLGLGYATLAENAWIVGGSPTEGFLKFATKGPFAEFFQSLAGSPAVDWFFMLGLLGIGLGLMFGIAIKLSSYSGSVLLILMYLAGSIWPEHNPIFDEHIIYALVILLFPLSDPSVLGISEWWRKKEFVRKYPVLE